MDKRQAEILRALVEEYIKEGEPISSGLLARSLPRWELSSATIRNELMALAHEGFLEQPYTSAGRVPTARGYRFFVDNFLEAPTINEEERQTLTHTASMIELSIFLARESRSMVLSCYDPREVFEAGLSPLLEEPEFSDRDFLVRFIKQVERLRQDFSQLAARMEQEPQLYIGEEGQDFMGDKRFSILFTPIKHKGCAFFLSPTRMQYAKSLALADFLSNHYDD